MLWYQKAARWLAAADPQDGSPCKRTGITVVAVLFAGIGVVLTTLILLEEWGLVPLLVAVASWLLLLAVLIYGMVVGIKSAELNVAHQEAK
ncbi:hypothetical protein IPM09_03120 [Candidatus Saccharibacteria bacterium]|nr:MAG: hypothetical protein IPM09_03120 [Candidatus Saccharibacteria bacterium]